MKKVALVLAVAGAAASAQAGTGLVVECSVNGGAFSPNVNALPGDNIVVQVRAFENDAAAAVGCAGVSFKVLLDDQAGEVFAPWSAPATSAGPEGPGVLRASGFGRVSPFASAAATTLPTLTPGAGTMLIGGSGTGGVIAAGQGSPALSGTKYDGSPNPILFRFGFQAGPQAVGSRTIDISITNILNNVGRWYTDLGSTSGNAVNLTVDSNPGGSVTITPTPASLALLGLGGLVAGRRRR